MMNAAPASEYKIIILIFFWFILFCSVFYVEWEMQIEKPRFPFGTNELNHVFDTQDAIACGLA